MSWEDFIEKKIMEPLQMTGSASTYSRIRDKTNVIDPHAPVDGVLRVIDRDFSETGDAAGGIYSNVTDLCKWVMMQMNNGRYGDSLKQSIFSREVSEAMWTPQTMIPVRTVAPYHTHFYGYGLGWFLSDVCGYKQVSHTGGLGGMVTQVTLLPEKKVGIIVLTNQQSGEAFYTITNTIKDGYLGVARKDWIKFYSESSAKQVLHARNVTEGIWKEIAQVREKEGQIVADSLITGIYRDPWLGEVTISRKNGRLWFNSKRSPKLSGELLAYKGNIFIARWQDRSMDADAFVNFSVSPAGKATGMTMKAISPLADFSFDFHDLNFTYSGPLAP
jgi:hypothetical protein